MNYIEELYTKCRQDGHLKKFETFDSFKTGFVDEPAIKKFYDFLIAKNYPVIEFPDFINEFNSTNNGSPSEKPNENRQIAEGKKPGLLDKWKKEINKLTQVAVKDLGIENKVENTPINEAKKYRITRNRDGSFNIGRNKVENIDNISSDLKSSEYVASRAKKKLDTLLGLDLSNSNISWLAADDVSFDGKSIRFDYEGWDYKVGSDVFGLKSFDGVWKNGFFSGKYFNEQEEPTYTEFKGEFISGEFTGELSYGFDYKNYKAAPWTYVDGKILGVFTDEDENKDSGILGLPFLNTLPENSQMKVHLIQLYKEDVLYVTDEDNHIHSVCITEVSFAGRNVRLKKRNGEFTEYGTTSNGIEIFSGSIDWRVKIGNFQGKDFNYKEYFGNQCDFLLWEEIRKDFNKYFIEIGKHFHLDGLIHISKVKSFSHNPPKGSSGVQHCGETIEFNSFKQLGIEKSIVFDCFGDEDQKILFNLHDSLYSGDFFNKLKSCKALLSSGYVKGFGKHKQLKKMFSEVEGDEMNYEKEEVKTIFDFLLKINLLITNAREKENRELLLSKFKELLFASNDDSTTNSAVPQLFAEIDFSKEERLGIDVKINFGFVSEQEKWGFNQMAEDIGNGKFYLMLMQTQRLIQNEELSGYHDKLELSILFNEQGNPNAPESEKAKNSLEYLSRVKRYMIDTAHPKEDAEKLITIIKLIITDNY